MDKDILQWDETIFKNEGMFELDYIPESFIHRESQMQSLKFNIRPAMRGTRPVNTLCIGPPATGKTTAVLKLFEEAEKHTSKVIPVYINCQITSTRHTIFSQIYKKVFGHAPPASGISFKKIFEEIAKRLLDEEIVVVVALDDINYLFYENEVNKVLYSILRAHETYPGIKFGVIGILSDLKVGYSFDPRVDSIFLPDEIYFPLYSREEIYEILKNRVIYGFYPKVVSEELLTDISDKVEKSGDLRVGIDLLRRAGFNAEKRGSRKISIDDVDNAYKKSGLIHLSYTISSLKKEEKALLKMIAGDDRSDKSKTKAGDLYKIFKEETNLSYTTFHEMLNKLDTVRLINMDFTGEGDRGRSRVITLRYDVRDVLSRLPGDK